MGGGGGLVLKKNFFLFSLCKMANTEFSTHIFNRYLSNEQSPFGNNSRAESTIFCMERISYSLKLLSGHFMGNP